MDSLVLQFAATSLIVSLILVGIHLVDERRWARERKAYEREHPAD